MGLFKGAYYSKQACCGTSVEQLWSENLWLPPSCRNWWVQHENNSVLLYIECHKTFVEAINKCTDVVLLLDEYIFAVSSDNNSEFWLSLNESPENLQRLVYVGEVCLV